MSEKHAVQRHRVEQRPQLDGGDGSVRHRAHDIVDALAGDRRINRTRRALHSALLELMIEKGYEATSIQDLVDRADVGRSTFYTHYADKDDLLREAIDGLGDFLREAAHAAVDDDVHPALAFSGPMILHMLEMRDLAAAVLGSSGLGHAHRHVHKMLRAMVHDSLGARAIGGFIPADVAASYVVESFLAVARWWLLEAPGKTPAEVHRIFLGLVGPALNRRP